MATKKKAAKKAATPKKTTRKKNLPPQGGPVLNTAERSEPVTKPGKKDKKKPLDLEARVAILEKINDQHGHFLKEE